jgi:hypothetical protein
MDGAGDDACLLRKPVAAGHLQCAAGGSVVSSLPGGCMTCMRIARSIVQSQLLTCLFQGMLSLSRKPLRSAASALQRGHHGPFSKCVAVMTHFCLYFLPPVVGQHHLAVLACDVDANQARACCLPLLC